MKLPGIYGMNSEVAFLLAVGNDNSAKIGSSLQKAAEMPKEKLIGYLKKE